MGDNWKKLGDISDRHLTPMLRQYLQAKAECADSILFFRMGDFFEMFFEDAIEASRILGLTLTSRDGTDKGDRVPMAGVPFRAVDNYVAKLIRAGKTVTICDQIEDPAEAKGIVKRAVIRTITPGTVMEPNLLDETANNYLAALSVHGGQAGLAFVDVTTGEFLAARIDGDPERVIQDELTRMAPTEVLIPADLDEKALERLKRRFDAVCFTPRPEHDFDPEVARERLLDQFGLSTLKGLGLEDLPEATGCAGAVLAYVKDTQRGCVPHLRYPRHYSPSHFVVLDGNTQRNLELVESLADRRKQGTLLGVLDRTHTSMGGRKLRHWILHPLVDVEAIRQRLDAVENLFGDAELRIRLKEALQDVADLERLLGRLTSKSGNARDLLALGRSLEQAPVLRAILAEAEAPMLAALRDGMDSLDDVAGWIRAAIVDEPPVPITEGNLFKDGYHEDLDHLRSLVRGGRDWIATLQREESARTGIPNLKVGYNKVFGYFIEVSRGNLNLVPADYERKQTLVNAERFVTPRLKSREEEIVTAQERMQKLEYDLFVALRERVAAEARRIQETADAMATVDALLSFAEVAATKGYCKPTVDTSNELRIRDGRHPVVEDLMSRGDFVPNDTVLDPSSAFLQIVTGPNMAGKSTYLRQVALIALMAQIGSFTPAAEVRAGVVDRIFTRVGASDNLVRGESTFMVEMIETANILNSASERSLIVLDEIGRGTSTFDGISIAWSVAEHIHDHIRAKTLFATHYHELTDLANKLEHAKNVNVAVREWGGKVVFLYRIVDGGADHSYGIQVAKLAGLPPPVIERARGILESLEAGNPASVGLPQQMYLFGPETPSAEPSAVEKELESTDIDALSPREALEFLYHLKHLSNKPRR
ncbi:MAG TPA: DNA mismatch repair protein MutS [Candidatus Hydrogenedentes bacterium]|nr:DNA mismatch repair protein MutS [Candidatus Hydrogenedentota bacterium]HPC15755.1 DNA mismatch repair protein MutS [Candidatus Hydrogenedentota bacterium]HRT19621.1 DNA mismatch repair protein MutS [Candidatus Hydrogenedentota bacterium]HRT64396.1 DNA mismatch repair protein MutS [Candidatus Hydrogenedentota bacterium]